MFRVAICDDEQAICGEIEKILLDYSKERRLKIDVEIFSSGEKLCQALENGEMYYLLFLDIMLSQADGIQVCERIRTEYRNEDLQIVFISSNQNFAMRLFDGRPLNFLIKPLDPAKVISSLDKAVALWEKNDTYFKFQLNHTVRWEKVKDIKYFESADKKITMHMVDEDVTFYGKLSDISVQLRDTDFIQVHKSYLINYKFIKSINLETVELIGGISLPISKTFRMYVRDVIMKKREEMLNG